MTKSSSASLPPQTKPIIIVISSHVASSSVGNRAIVFALECLGFTVWDIPSIDMPWHPGHGPSTRITPPDDAFAKYCAHLSEHPDKAEVGAILTGYLGTPAQVAPIAALVKAYKAINPDLLYLCDPVIGDQGALYVPEAIAKAVRDHLLPLADIITPNRHEFDWLIGKVHQDNPDLAQSAEQMRPTKVVISSAFPFMRQSIANLCITPEDGAFLVEHPALETAPNGTGDVLAALYLAHRLTGQTDEFALQRAAASVFECVSQSARKQSRDMPLAQMPERLARPMALVNTRRLSPARSALNPRKAPKKIAGLHGFVAGEKPNWLAVQMQADNPASAQLKPIEAASDILAMRTLRTIATTCPFHLPAHIEGAGRACEQAIRPLLGARQSTVITMPAQPVLAATDRDEADALAEKHTNPARKVAQKAYQRFPLIRALQQAMVETDHQKLIETHAELAFRAMNGHTPMAEPRTIKGIPHPPGLAERRAHLLNEGFTATFLDQDLPDTVSRQDLYDAIAAAWVANRYLLKQAEAFPDQTVPQPSQNESPIYA